MILSSAQFYLVLFRGGKYNEPCFVCIAKMDTADAAPRKVAEKLATTTTDNTGGCSKTKDFIIIKN